MIMSHTTSSQKTRDMKDTPPGPSNGLLSIDTSRLKSRTDISPEQHQRNLNVALSHAFVIHHQKKVEAKILSDIEELVDFPASSEPSAVEVKTFLDAISLHQPSDFDDLVVERVSQSRCGHTLCARQPRSVRQKSKASRWRRDDGTEGSEQWCSDLCMDKSLWLRNQLRSEPAWQRPLSRSANIKLHPHDKHLLETNSELSAMDSNHAGMSELARERGDTATSWKPKQVMSTDILEKKISQSPQEPVADELTDRAGEVDGYTPASIAHTAKASSIDVTPIAKKTTVSGDGSTCREAQVEDKEADEQQWRDMFEHLRIVKMDGDKK